MHIGKGSSHIGEGADDQEQQDQERERLDQERRRARTSKGRATPHKDDCQCRPCIGRRRREGAGAERVDREDAGDQARDAGAAGQGSEGASTDGRGARRRAERERRKVRDEIILEDGRRLGKVMDDWQRADFEALDDPRFKHAYLERPRGHSKTGDVGSEAVVELLAGDRAKVLLCYAADEDQARLLFDDVKGKLIRGRHVQEGRGGLVKGKVRSYRNQIVSWNGSTLTVETADVASSWGKRPDWLALDEIVEWRSPELWQSLWSATGKKPKTRVLVISTAGWDQSHFAWDVREIARTEPDWYFSTRGQCASWVKPEWLAQQQRTLPAHVFARVHENRWVEGAGAFLTAEEVDAIFNGVIPPAGGRYAIGLDVGLTKDRTVMSVIRIDPAGILVVTALETWQGSKGSKVDLGEVENTAFAVSTKFHAPVWLDPFQAVQLGQNLVTRGRVVKEYTVTPESWRKLFNVLLSAVRDRRLRSQPHVELRKELLGLEVKETLAGFRVDHKLGRFDDHAFSVALGIMGATERARSFGFAKGLDGKFVSVITHDYTRRQSAALHVDSRGNRYMGDGLCITPSGERYRDPRY